MEMSASPGAPLLTALERLAPHDHLCSIYESMEEHYAVAMPFIRIGLDRGEKCIYIADDGTEAVVRDAMHAEGIDVERAIATDRLVLEKKEAAYLKHGSFDPEWMFTFWADATAEAMRQGFSALRATGETEWVLRGAQGLERWMEYESRLTHMLAHHNCFALCQYNRQLFPPELVLDVIRTHPTVIYRGVVCRNVYYVPPDELLGANGAALEVERLLTNIRERETTVPEPVGPVKRMVGVAEDITDTQRQLEEIRIGEAALRTSEERWRLVFENSAIGIVLADPSGKFVETNRAFQELVGYTNQELKTLTYRDITHEADLSRGAEVVQQLLTATAREVQIEKRYRHKDGRFIWVRATGTAIPGPDGSPQYLLGLVEDVTDRKSAEQELDCFGQPAARARGPLDARAGRRAAPDRADAARNHGPGSCRADDVARAAEPDDEPNERHRSERCDREHLARRAVDRRHPDVVVSPPPATARRDGSGLGTPVVRRRVRRAQRHHAGRGAARALRAAAARHGNGALSNRPGVVDQHSPPRRE